jgi:hypothetical protein
VTNARRRGAAPFFLAPAAFALSHLPLEPNWQLLPSPIADEEFWARPEVGPAFFEAGGQLLHEAGSFWAVNVLPPVRWAGGWVGHAQQGVEGGKLEDLCCSWLHPA